MSGWPVSVALILELLACVIAEGDPQVATSTGTFVGKRLTLFNGSHQVDAYLGIPYAKPPLGSARYARAEPLERSNQTIKAQKLPPACVQLSLPLPFGWMARGKKSENCLFLNIWVPVSESGDRIGKAVMVWIHGGAFFAGSSEIKFYNGKIMAALGDVIVVSLNYRLGNLGFLNLGIREAEGNMGLYDQNLALQWIKFNIGNFGGDPSSITLFGHSAGSISASLHLSSPMSSGLFNRAILQSGTSYAPVFIQNERDSRQVSRDFAEAAGCVDADPYKLLDCLQNRTTRRLLRAEFLLNQNLTFFFPRQGDLMVPGNPIEDLRRGRFQQANIMIGNVVNEGFFSLNLIFPKIFLSENRYLVNKSEARDLLTFALGRVASIPHLDRILQTYLEPIQKEDDYPNVRNAFQSVLGDFLIFCPTLFYASTVASHFNSVYYYLYSQVSSIQVEDRQKWINITHFDEVPYVFGYPLEAKENYTIFEKQFSKNLIQLWTTFAKNGYPKSDVHYYWPLYGTSQPYGLELNADRAGLRPNPSMEKCLNVWGPLYFHIPRTRSAAPWMRFK